MRSGARQRPVRSRPAPGWRPLLAMAGALSLIWLPVAANVAHAKKVTSQVRAVVSGKTYKSSRRSATGIYHPETFSVTGATKPRRRIVRTISINCLGDVTTLALPFTLPCFGSYTVAGGHAPAQTWSSNATELTVESVVGNRITGRFQGELTLAGEPPLSITEGVFSLPLTGLGG